MPFGEVLRRLRDRFQVQIDPPLDDDEDGRVLVLRRQDRTVVTHLFDNEVCGAEELEHICNRLGVDVDQLRASLC